MLKRVYKGREKKSCLMNTKTAAYHENFWVAKKEKKKKTFESQKKEKKKSFESQKKGKIALRQEQDAISCIQAEFTIFKTIIKSYVCTVIRKSGIDYW